MTSSKLYIEIVKKLQLIIVEDGLVPGDKIPSERELSDRLNVGRSSVREALRALELLGLIETRRGEGTYIKDFGENQLVQILGTFILQGVKKKSDLLETKYIIECECIKLAIARINESQVEYLELKNEQGELTFTSLFKVIVEATDNLLVLRIWQVLTEYHETAFTPQEKFEFANIIKGLRDRDVESVMKEYHRFVSND
ncbi:FadR/GntR family transcriptional regulator [Litchfieldia salsa]|uniref:DNA-binding transcriptional regulator, FadR family n=1 Tax=Litchfieldia salsa TaxID=930152 RepID=A0A1H0P3L7_9BACI|nr:GntR family transcriptional regulator [Litchfieldia salsa]SDO99296.1 DNA-binding transcriptional regulator, FadR family [Litchfieldia salsa]